ncbi:hypothetical protein ACFLV1_02195 [Chloroflexota bacterium]
MWYNEGMEIVNVAGSIFIQFGQYRVDIWIFGTSFLVLLGTLASIFGVLRGFDKDRHHVKLKVLNTLGNLEGIVYRTYVVKVINNSYVDIQVDYLISETIDKRKINLTQYIEEKLVIRPNCGHDYFLDNSEFLSQYEGTSFGSFTINDAIGNQYTVNVGKRIKGIKSELYQWST